MDLDNVERRHRENPETFEILPLAVRRRLGVGRLVKLIFLISADEGPQGERMWVKIIDKGNHGNGNYWYKGTLDNEPAFADLSLGDEISFGPEHIAMIYPETN